MAASRIGHAERGPVAPGCEEVRSMYWVVHDDEAATRVEVQDRGNSTFLTAYGRHIGAVSFTEQGAIMAPELRYLNSKVDGKDFQHEITPPLADEEARQAAAVVFADHAWRLCELHNATEQAYQAGKVVFETGRLSMDAALNSAVGRPAMY